MSMQSDLARAKVSVISPKNAATAPKIDEKKKTIKKDYDLVLNHMQFEKFRKPHGHVVQIRTERTADTNQQVGPVVLHTVLDVGFFEHIMKVAGASEELPYGFQPDYVKAIGALEGAMKSLNLFGKDAKYQQINHPGSFYDSTPPLKRPAKRRDYDGIVVYANSMKYHFDDCEFASSRSLPRPDSFAHCPACAQKKNIDFLRGMGVLLHTPPLRMAKEFGSATVDRLHEIREAMESFTTSEVLNKLENLVAAGNSDEIQKYLPYAIEEMKNKQYYARRQVDDVFERMNHEATRLDQKGIDSFISAYIARIGTFAEKCGGRHIIGLMAGDGDFQTPVWEAILNSSWRDSSPNKHDEPRVKVVVFSRAGMSNGFLTGEYLPEKIKSVDPLDRWRYELIMSGLNNFPITREFAEKMKKTSYEERMEDNNNNARRDQEYRERSVNR